MNCFDEKGNTINSLTQWEQGRELTVKDLSPDKAYMAHVFNNYSTKAKVVPATNVGGNVTFPVPNILLQKPYTLLAVVYEKQGAKRLSVGKIILNVESAAMPEDYEFVENVEYTDWVELTSEARTLLDQLQTDAQVIERVITPAKANNLGALVIENNVKGNPILLKDSADAKVVELEITGSTTQNGVPSPEKPVEIVNGTYDNIRYNGKNLIPFPYRDTTKTVNGVTFNVNKDGTVETSGTATDNTVFFIQNIIHLNNPYKKGTYFLSGCPKNNTGNKISINFNVAGRDYGDGAICQINEQTDQTNIVISIQKGINADGLVFKPQLELGSQATPYEPYKGFSESISPIELSKYDKIKKIDGVWKKEIESFYENITLEHSMKLGIAGSDKKRIEITLQHDYFNYNDNNKNGELYCNIEPTKTAVENFRGEPSISAYIGRTNVIYLYDDKFQTIEEFKNYLTSNKVEIFAKLANPTYEVLPKETQDVLNKVQTFYPNSVIQTNDGIELNIKYVADTKNYIDNKFNELQTAIVAVGGNV